MIDHDVRSPVAEPVRSTRHRLDGDGSTGLVLGAALVAMALVAGLIYTFSVAVMPNLADADDRTFVATMQRFNQNPVFQITFTAALVLTALAAVLQRRHRPGIAVRWTVAALVLYGIVLAVTAGINIPLNNELDHAGDPDRIADLAHVRNQFEGPGWPEHRPHPVRHRSGRRPRPRPLPARTQHSRPNTEASAGEQLGAARHRIAAACRHPPNPARQERPMTEDLITAGAVAAAVGCALVAGLLFAFSTSVMPALRQRPAAEGIAVMQTINSTILNPLFGLVFGGTTLLSLLLAASAPFTTDESHATLRGIGSALYVVGVFIETMAVNVPMNNALDAVDRRRRGRVDLAHVPASLDSVEPRAGASGDRSIGDCSSCRSCDPGARPGWVGESQHLADDGRRRRPYHLCQ